MDFVFISFFMVASIYANVLMFCHLQRGNGGRAFLWFLCSCLSILAIAFYGDVTCQNPPSASASWCALYLSSDS